MLAVRATTDQRALRRILEERGIQIALGLSSSDLTEELLRAFRQTIETPKRRVTAELFALHSVDPAPPIEQLAVLRERAQGASGLERTLLFHDVAVTAQLVWALTDPESAQGLEALRISLSAWRPVLREKEFWQYLADRSEGATSGEELWQECVAGLVRSAAEVAASLLAGKQLGQAVAVVGVLRDAALPGDTIDKALSEMTREIRGEIAAAIQRIGSRAEGTVDDARLDEIVLINEVLGPHQRLTLLGLSSVSPDELAGAIRAVSVRIYNRTQDPFVAAALLDAGLTMLLVPRLASAFAADRATVLRLHHQERALTAWQAAQWPAAAAHATLAADVSSAEETESLRTMATRSTASSTASDVAALVRRAQAPFDAERKAVVRRIYAAAHFENWSGEGRAYTNPSGNNSGVTESATAQATPVAALPTGRSQRGRWISAAVLVGLLLLGWANGSFAGSSRAPSTNAPAATNGTTRPPVSTPQRATPTIAACVSDLATMKAAIASTTARLRSMEANLSALEARMNSLKGSIQSTEATYPGGIPSSIYPSYSAQVDDYNRLRRQYLADYADYETQFAQNDSAITRHNALLATCR